MFGLGTWEILMILIAALVFIGPTKLPSLARTMGKGKRDVRRAMAGFEDEVRKASDISETAAPPAEPQPQTVSRANDATSSDDAHAEAADDDTHAEAADDDAHAEAADGGDGEEQDVGSQAPPERAS